MSNELDAGKAAITLTLDDAALKSQLQQAAGAVEQIGTGAGVGMGRSLDAVGKAINLIDKQAGGAIGGLVRNLGPMGGIISNIAQQMTIAAAGAGGLKTSIAALGSQLAALKIPHLAAFFGGFAVGKWLVGKDEIDESLYALQNYANQYAKIQNELAAKDDAQIARLKQLAKAQSLTNEERKKALEIAQKMGAADAVKFSGGRLQLNETALQDVANNRRIKGQEAIVNESRENLRRLQAKRDAIGEQGQSILQWAGITSNPNDEKLQKLGDEINAQIDKVAEEERKLADMRQKTGVDAIRAQMDAERQAIEKRKTIADNLKKIETEAAQAGLEGAAKQKAALIAREKEVNETLRKSGAGDAEYTRALKAFNALFDEIDKGAKKASDAAAKTRQKEIDKLATDAARASAQAAEKAAIDLAGVAGSGAKAGAIDKLIAQYQTATQAGRGRLDALGAQLKGKDTATTEYKQLEEQYKTEFEAFTQNLNRMNELMREKNDIAAGETQRAAQYAKDNGKFFEQMKAQNAIAKDAFALSQFTDAAKQSGNVAALEEYAQAARNAANAAEQAAGMEWQKAMADGRLTEEEEKLLEAMKNHAAEQNQMAQELEQAAEQTRIDGQKAGGAGGGFDAQAVIAKAMAQAMRQDKSLGYQKDTAQGVKKLVELEQKRRDAVLTFTK